MKISLFFVILASLTAVGRAQPAPPTQPLPWDLEKLYQVPAMTWLNQHGAVHSLTYRGEPYQEHETEVFAFYASPATLGEGDRGKKYPGVVLIHGGGGTAFAEWVWLWARRGYAAIAMDLSGRRPTDPTYDAKTGAPLTTPNDAKTRLRLPNGGPEQGHPEKFESIGGTVSDDWPYHAVASVVRAHSLLRSFPEVDAERTGVTGISWGGFTTCLVASVDARFKAAVPVYGCGFLFEGESVQRPQIDRLADRREEWIRRYDPSNLLPRCRIPILFVNGTNDIHYTLDSYQKSFDVVPSANKQLRIEVNMRHSHPAGWAPEEIGLFIDAYCRGGAPLPRLGTPEAGAGEVRVPLTVAVPAKEAALHFTTDAGLRSKRAWRTLSAKIDGLTIIAPAPPKEANTWFVSATDERGAMTTTTVQFKN